MSDFENQKTIDGNIYHCEAECSLESKENENPSDLDFFAPNCPAVLRVNKNHRLTRVSVSLSCRKPFYPHFRLRFRPPRNMRSG